MNSNSLKVNVSSLSRFHAFDLANQLSQLNVLKTLYTAYPKSRIGPTTFIKCTKDYPWFYTPVAFLNQLGWTDIYDKTGLFLATTFDRWVAKNLSPADVFHCLSGFGLLSHETAKKRYESLTVCDRGSSHIEYQSDLLESEYIKWGISRAPMDPRVIQRELDEYQLCDIIIVPSEFARRSFIDRGIPEGKVYKVPYGVDLDLFSPTEKEDQRFRVLYAGTLSIRKGVGYLLEAMRKLNNSAIEVWLVGGMSEEIKTILEKYEGLYRYLGFVPRKRLAKIMSNCSIFVLPSIEDGFGLVMAQAMACGLPVIASANTGAYDLFKDGVEGFIVPAANPDAIMNKVQWLYENPGQLDEMRMAGRKNVQDLGGWSNYGKSILEIYRRTISH